MYGTGNTQGGKLCVYVLLYSVTLPSSQLVRSRAHVNPSSSAAVNFDSFAAKCSECVSCMAKHAVRFTGVMY